MNEEFILDMLTLHGGLYKKFGSKNDERAFANWMHELRRLKKFNSIEETCEYFLKIWFQKPLVA